MSPNWNLINLFDYCCDTEAAEKGAGGRGRQAGGRVGWGRGGRRKFYLRVELIKCIDPNEGEALKRGREGEGGEGGEQTGGREGRVGHRGQKEILPEGGIDQMYWSKWRWGIEEGVHLQTWGSGAPYPSVPPPGGGGRGARGREDIGL